MRSIEVIKDETVSNNGHGAGVGATATCPTYITAAVTIQSAAALVADAVSSIEASPLSYGDELDTPG